MFCEHIQEWEVPLDPKIPDHGGQFEDGPLFVCHLFGSVCDNQLRILRNALVHYPALSKLQGQVYEAIRKSNKIAKLDAGIKNHDYQLLLEACELTFDKLFDRNCVEPQDVGKCSDTLKHRYAKTSKKVRDYAVHVLQPIFPTCSVHSLPESFAWLTVRRCVGGRIHEEEYMRKNTCVTTVNQR